MVQPEVQPTHRQHFYSIQNSGSGTIKRIGLDVHWFFFMHHVHFLCCSTLKCLFLCGMFCDTHTGCQKEPRCWILPTSIRQICTAVLITFPSPALRSRRPRSGAPRGRVRRPELQSGREIPHVRRRTTGRWKRLSLSHALFETRNNTLSMVYKRRLIRDD